MCAALLLAFWPPQTSRADDDSVAIHEVVVGFDGFWKVGEWAPVRVLASFPRASKAALVIECLDADENLTEIPSEIHTVEAGQAWLQGGFKAGRVRGDMRVRVVDREGKSIASARLRNGTSVDDARWTWNPGMRLETTFWLALGKPGGLDQINSTGSRDAPITVVNVSPDHLPRFSHLLAGVDGIIVSASPEVLSDIDPRQDLAIRDWVRTGGHLFVGVGGPNVKAVLRDYAPPFIRPEKSQKPLPIAQWSPITGSGTVEVRLLTGLESYVGQASPLRFTGSIDSPRLTDVSGTVLVSGTFGPILVRAPFGFGRVTLLGVDVERPPLANWSALPRLYRRALGVRGTDAGQPAEGGRQLTRGGITDLASQLHATQEDFPGIHRPTFWQVMGLLLIVLLVVGPLDYLVVTRWLKRPGWTWITLPACVILGGVALQVLAISSNGTRQLTNELDVVDIDAATRTVRGRSWLTIYTPESRRFDVSVDGASDLPAPGARPPKPAGPPEDPPIRRETMLSWSAPPEESLGGIYRSGGANLTQRGYQFDGTTAGLIDLPVSQWSTKSLVAEWTQTTEAVIDSQLEGTSLGRLTGSIRHRLPGILEQALLVHGGHVYIPPGSSGRLTPGQVWRPANARGLKSVLTNARTVPIFHRESRTQQYLTQPEPYSASDHDPDALVRMLSFHEGADGSRYTGLRHAALSRMEVTPLLELDRAILVGRLKASPVKWSVNGRELEATTRHTYVRLLLPVARATAGTESRRPFLGPTE